MPNALSTHTHRPVYVPPEALKPLVSLSPYIRSNTEDPHAFLAALSHALHMHVQLVGSAASYTKGAEAAAAASVGSFQRGAAAELRPAPAVQVLPLARDVRAPQLPVAPYGGARGGGRAGGARFPSKTRSLASGPRLCALCSTRSTLIKAARSTPTSCS